MSEPMTNEEMLKVLEDEVKSTSHHLSILRENCEPDDDGLKEAIRSEMRYLQAFTRALAIVKAAVEAKESVRNMLNDYHTTTIDRQRVNAILSALNEEEQTCG